jgi:hypothetical protein
MHFTRGRTVFYVCSRRTHNSNILRKTISKAITHEIKLYAAGYPLGFEDEAKGATEDPGE